MTTHTAKTPSDDLPSNGRSRLPFAQDDAAEPASAISVEERRRLERDLEVLRVQEQNLQAYESRLREWQAQLDQRQQGTRFMPAPVAAQLPTVSSGEVELREAWVKLHRARALLEVEQKHLVDDRLALREHEQALKLREAALVAREERIAEREKQLKPAASAPAAAASTRSPFAMAKSVLGMRA